MVNELTFVIDENVFMWATSGGPVAYNGGYRRVGPDDRRGLDLFAAVESRGHRLALSGDLWARYSHHDQQLRRSGLPMVVPDRPVAIVGRLWQAGRVDFEPQPGHVALPAGFPVKDSHLADLAALSSGAIVVTEDGGILRSVKSANPAPAFRAANLDEAIALAKGT